MGVAGEVGAQDTFDVTALQVWLARWVPGMHGVLPEVLQYSSGSSNLTYLLRYPARELVLRRPPHGITMLSAHDMGREVTVLRALGKHLDVVPEVFGYCTDRTVIGSEFYVMQKMEGEVLGPRLPPGVTLSEQAARALGESMIDTLADLHAVDVQEAGLTVLSNGPGYVRREVAGWTKRWLAVLTDDVPDGEKLVGWLNARQPADTGSSLLHGEWTLDNLVVDLSGPPRVVGVLDWETATVGDPLMDLGAALAYWPTDLPGLPTREQAAERYLSRTGRGPADLPFYQVFGLFRRAVICQRDRVARPGEPAAAAPVHTLLDQATALADGS